jgi:magnesium transporter
MHLSCLKTSAPSSTLLKFLRSQSENLCFSPSNIKPGQCPHRTFRELTAHFVNRRSKDPASARLISTEGPRRGHVEASLLRADLLRPTSKVRKPTALLSTLVTISSLHDCCAVWQQQSRHASTSSHPWLRRLWDFKSSTGQTRLKPDDLPPLTSFLDEGAETSMFSLGRSLAGKASNELKLRCTEFDENGNVTLVNGEFKKSELIAKVSIARFPFHTACICTHADMIIVRSPPTRPT